MLFHTNSLSPSYRVWKSVFKFNAKVYTGLYSSVQHVVDGTSKKAEKVLKEWCTRTDHQFGSSKVNEICQKKILPLVQISSPRKREKVAKCLLAAAKAAGIQMDCAKELILKENNIGAYIDLNDNELFEDDVIEVVSPAWFQNGVLIEQGYCYKKHNDK